MVSEILRNIISFNPHNFGEAGTIPFEKKEMRLRDVIWQTQNLKTEFGYFTLPVEFLLLDYRLCCQNCTFPKDI